MISSPPPLPGAAPAGASRSIYGLALEPIAALLAADAVAPVHARALWRALYRDAAPLLTREDLPPPLRRWIAAHADRFTPVVEPVADTASRDGLTRKFLLRLADGQTIEAVLMSYDGRTTACVSTQAGCAMGCVFCATGQMGFIRHLRPEEIVAQVRHVQRVLREQERPGLRNLVLMGMGEPLHNYDAVIAALRIISDRAGLNVGPARISISTVGVVPGITRLADEAQPYNLAVSLHGAAEEERAALVPISRRWSLAELIAACRDYSTRMQRKIFFEWTLIAGVNDTPDHAARLGALLAGIQSHVNLIPLNPTHGFAGTASAAGERFQKVLREAGIPSTVRQRRGIDVAAGCGQLRAERERRPATAAALRT